nr:unnamed protein product [Digitaria exilis]
MGCSAAVSGRAGEAAVRRIPAHWAGFLPCFLGREGRCRVLGGKRKCEQRRKRRQDCAGSEDGQWRLAANGEEIVAWWQWCPRGSEWVPRHSVAARHRTGQLSISSRDLR